MGSILIETEYKEDNKPVCYEYSIRFHRQSYAGTSTTGIYLHRFRVLHEAVSGGAFKTYNVYGDGNFKFLIQQLDRKNSKKLKKYLSMLNDNKIRAKLVDILKKSIYGDRKEEYKVLKAHLTDDISASCLPA